MVASDVLVAEGWSNRGGWKQDSSMVAATVTVGWLRASRAREALAARRYGAITRWSGSSRAQARR